MLNVIYDRVIESSVSVRRISEFLKACELDPEVITRVSPMESNDNVIAIEGNYTWDDEGNEVGLADLNLVFPRGSMTMIIGETGSGKSALLSAILGEINQASGTIKYEEHLSVAYSTQVPWIQNATVRDNILFGRDFDETRYWEVVECCALASDFAILADGDLTEIGEKGINLSGGQKQRVALARAVYRDSDVLIFDDPLSAVDSHVANHIFKQCMMAYCKDAGKTVILATHAVSFLKHADNVIVMEAGRVAMQGQLEDLIAAKVNLTKFVLSTDSEKKGDGDDKDKDDVSPVIGSAAVADEDSDTISTEEKVKEDAAIAEDDDEEEDEEILLERQKSDVMDAKAKIKEIEEKKKGKGDETGKLIDAEERAAGEIDLKVFKVYVDAGGGIIFTILLIFSFALYMCMSTLLYVCVLSSFCFLLCLMNVVLLTLLLHVVCGQGASFWLGKWSKDKDTNGDRSEHSSWYYLGIYAAIQFISLFFLLGALILVLVTRLRASSFLHNVLLDRLLHAPMSFFDTTPIGRIINRYVLLIYRMCQLLPLDCV